MVHIRYQCCVCVCVCVCADKQLIIGVIIFGSLVLLIQLRMFTHASVSQVGAKYAR